MGNQKQKWTAEEEEALLAGVAKHGPGKWKNILRDPQFAPSLTQRSNIDLKDKWRNLSVSNAQQGSKDKIRGPKLKTTVVAPLSNTPNSAPAASLTRNVSSGAVMNDTSTSALDGKNGPKYNAMIFEAISTLKDANGSDISAIANFIEERQEAPPNFRRLLSSRLRRLVSQGKLEKVRNCYKIRKETSIGVKTPTPKQKDARLRPPRNSALMTSREIVEEASITAAYRIAEAENKSFLAAEAFKEAERVSKMAEDTDAMLQLVKEIYERCSFV
ncbi:telomere repeat-binding factor 4 [Citrus sinensis]|uniref:MYB transcription factor n=2 Tax=Citrus TaxID=2706 RepID=A0A067FPQ2_CITSI|nr:hypothetical protein CICLE_v10026245mg [Citrus x clementina]KAH9665034.1 telomere repeat-binding factor 4 [Citrus sinensis]KDO65146.1 hypothetical protein CISIN_1g023740mg [Citrus sinensis]